MLPAPDICRGHSENGSVQPRRHNLRLKVWSARSHRQPEGMTLYRYQNLGTPQPLRRSATSSELAFFQRASWQRLAVAALLSIEFLAPPFQVLLAGSQDDSPNAL